MFWENKEKEEQRVRYITDLNSIADMKDSVITLGKFDGVHRGHQKLIRQVKKIAEKEKLSTVVFTFDVSPQVKLGMLKSPLLMTNEERRSTIEEMGLDYLVECPFTDEVKNMEPEDFVTEILCRRLKARALVVGSDFHFGKKRRGDAALLLKMGEELGLEVCVETKEKDGHREISSTYVREELAEGHMEKVADLLGVPYSVKGEIVHGNHIGHKLGFPTINQIPEKGKMLPPKGVYLSKTLVDGREYDGISNVGTKPTVQGESLMGIETHLLFFSGDLYGKEARVQLLSFRRPEMKFGSLAELKAQLDHDILEARNLAIRKYAEEDKKKRQAAEFPVG